MQSNEGIPNITNSQHRDDELEAKILGIVLSNNRYADQILPFLLPEDFANISYRHFFEVIVYLYKNAITINDYQIFEHTKQNPKSLVNKALLMELYNSAGLVSNIQSYLEKLVKLTKLRKIASIERIISAKLSKDSGLVQEDEIVSSIQEVLYDIDRNNFSQDFLPASKVSHSFYQDLERQRSLDMHDINGIATRYAEFDNITQGLHGGELIVLAARPGMGKTAFALNIATNIASSKDRDGRTRKAAFFSLEMAPKQLMIRIYSYISGIELTKLKRPQMLTDEDMYTTITSVKNNVIEKLNLFIDDTVDNDIDTIIWKCRRLHKVDKLDLIVIDYMQLISIKGKAGDNRQQEITKISRRLKALSLELNVPILVLSQLNRQTENRENKRPLLSDLRESGAIEQDADLVLFLYREEYYASMRRKDETNPENEALAKIHGEPIELIIAKHRNGATGVIKLGFVPYTGKFNDLGHRIESEI
ncbi:replicative DNA helicase [Mycoplasmopsis opalescens]|uniref:replicative DNA helicase n=1 Tax=Mycoplasmopsis opalescens TaxID=114886 RepID=UPI0004A6FB6D|nr:replicative DNA helicase [Mycoplasmopsis opalescens]